jgi:mono/diheme cytochrome c family protein
MRLPILPALILLLPTACTSGPSSAELAEAEKAAMSDALGLAVARIDPLELRLKTLVRDNIAGHAGLKKGDLWGMRWEEVELRGRTGELIRARVLSVPLNEPAGPGTMYFAFDREARLVSIGLEAVGLDDDGHAQWPGFLAQFRGRRAVTTGELPTPGAAFEITQAAAADPSGRVATLYEQQRLMAENSARMAQVLALTGRGEMPSSDLLREWAARYGALHELSPRLEPVLGSSVRDSAKYVRAGEEILAQAAFAASAGQASEVRRLVGGELNRASCQACHQAESSKLGGPRREALQDRLAEFGAPALYRVGQDVWSPSGREHAAQYLASLSKAALLIGGVLRADGQL